MTTECCAQTRLFFYVTIWDVNNHAPVFVNAPYVVNISEVQFFDHITALCLKKGQ